MKKNISIKPGSMRLLFRMRRKKFMSFSHSDTLCYTLLSFFHRHSFTSYRLSPSVHGSVRFAAADWSIEKSYSNVCMTTITKFKSFIFSLFSKWGEVADTSGPWSWGSINVEVGNCNSRLIIHASDSKKCQVFGIFLMYKCKIDFLNDERRILKINGLWRRLADEKTVKTSYQLYFHYVFHFR